MRIRAGNLSEVGLEPGSEANAIGRAKPHGAWVAAAALMTVVGVLGAVLAANAVATNSADQSARQFRGASANVAAKLQLAIQHEQDLTVSAAGFIAGNPTATNAEFRHWAKSVQALTRYPELIEIGEAVLVPASGLAAYAARAVADPVGPLAAHGTFQVVPPGRRPFYCFESSSLNASANTQTPAGLDVCDYGGFGGALLAARASGQGAYLPAKDNSQTILVVETPVYRDAANPATVAARQAAFLGWLGTLLLPSVVLRQALVGSPGLAVSLTYHVGSLQETFRSGTMPHGARSVTTSLHNGWTVQTFGAVAAGGIFGNENALALLVPGIALSLLVAALVLVLATGRRRALRLVQERTAQLQGAQAQLVDAARQAGMAEIATNVLHNVGNVLNSVNVSAHVVAQKVRGSKSAGLAKAVALMREHAADLGNYLTVDVKGRALPDYLDQLATALATERESIEVELRRLNEGVAHIAEIVSAQQSLAVVNAVIEPISIADVVEDALRMAGVADQPGLTVTRDLPDVGLIPLDRHRVLLILVNLLTNAAYATGANADRPRQLSVRAEVTDRHTVVIAVADNGEGVVSENLAQIFVHGFTTHADGHGFGLHSSALAAQEMGGALSVHSDGTDTGARFVLEVPLERHTVAA